MRSVQEAPMTTDIVTVKGGCPICKGDVKGNDHAKYFCQKCNILFSKESLE